MISGTITQRFALTLNALNGRTFVGQGAITRKLMPLAIVIGAGMMTITSASVTQASVTQSVESTLEATVQSSTCVTDPSGLVCSSNSELKVERQVKAPQTTTSAASLPHLLSNAQMERLADIFLGLTYFVLPIGFGLGLFLYDRHQAHRAALLDAQIKLLERLWKQSPQA